MSVSRRPKGDVLGRSRNLWDDIKDPRDSRNTILLHLDTVPSNIFNIHIVAVKISKIWDDAIDPEGI
jgi:hypothetical protein